MAAGIPDLQVTATTRHAWLNFCFAQVWLIQSELPAVAWELQTDATILTQTHLANFPRSFPSSNLSS